MVEKGLISEGRISLSDAERLFREEVRNSTRRQLEVWRQTEEGRLEGGSQVFRALAFANLSGKTRQLTRSWLEVQRKKPEDLSWELRLARELIPKEGENARAFTNSLSALDYWRDCEGLTWEPFPDVVELFGDDKERQRWEELQQERSLPRPGGGGGGGGFAVGSVPPKENLA